MPRSDILLAALAAADGGKFTPAQLQKAIFIISKKVPHLFNDEDKYDFVPYNYGPFDATVYHDAEMLRSMNWVDIYQSTKGNWKEYAVTPDGLTVGRSILHNIPERERNYIESVVSWVRSLSFQQLVKSIYDAYPEMRVNSIFRG